MRLCEVSLRQRPAGLFPAGPPSSETAFHRQGLHHLCEKARSSLEELLDNVNADEFTLS